MTTEKATLLLKFWLNECGVIYEEEYKFHPERNWRLDIAIPSPKLGFEIDGGIFTHGRHVRGVGYCKDCIKFLHAAHLGWTILRLPLQWFDHHKFKVQREHLVCCEDLEKMIKERIKDERYD